MARIATTGRSGNDILAYVIEGTSLRPATTVAGERGIRRSFRSGKAAILYAISAGGCTQIDKRSRGGREAAKETGLPLVVPA